MKTSALVIGRVAVIEPFYRTHNIDYMRMLVEVERSNGVKDLVPVVYESTMFPTTDFVKVEGVVRSRNSFDKRGKRHTHRFVYATSIEESDGKEYANCITVSGNLCGEPIPRETSVGRPVCDLMLTTIEDGYISFLNCVCFGKAANVMASLSSNTEVIVSGAFHSRHYEKLSDGKAVKYEIFEIYGRKVEVVKSEN